MFCYRKDAAPGDTPIVHARASTSPRAAPAPAPAASTPAPTERIQEPAGQVRTLSRGVPGRDEWARAEADVHDLIRSSPAFVPGQLLLAGLHAHRGRYAEAREQAKHVLSLNDTDARAYLLLGMIDARAGQAVEAVQSLRRALYLDDSLALAYFWLGNLYRDQGNADRACAEHMEVIRRHHHHALDFTEEFASDLTPAQIVDACRQSVRRLRGVA